MAKESYCAVHGIYPGPGEPCWSCINKSNEDGGKQALIEASYNIANETLKNVPKTKTVNFIMGYQKAATIAHDIIKKMIDEAK